MKAALLAFAALCCFADPLPLDEPRVNVIKFYRAFDVYVRELYGCDLKADISPETCHLERGVIDYAAYLKARNAAKRVFGFQE